jgi:hypothetical protein
MLGLTIHSSTNTNQLQLSIPDELKGIDLQIIIIPADPDSSRDNNQQIEFFTDADLQQLSKINLSTAIEDSEDYTKW